MQFQINEVLNEDSGYFVFQVPGVIKNPKAFTIYADDVTSEDAYASIKRELAYSFDGSNWSNYRPLTSALLKSDEILGKGDVKIRIRITRNQSTKPVKIETIDLDYTETPPEECEPQMISKYMGLEFCADADFDPYKISAQAAQLESAMNGYINKNLGMEVQYFHIKPDQDNADFILNEYSTFKESGEGGKCVKIMVPENSLPDPSLLHSEWGIDFEKFEVHVQIQYFETIWGKHEQPRQEDILYFPKFNKLFYVSSVKSVRGTDGIGQYWTMNLKRYDKNTAVALSETSQDIIDELTQGSSHDENFAVINQEEGKAITNEIQNEIKTIAVDSLRSFIDPAVSIADNQIINNGTPIANHQYQLSDGAPGAKAVIYKPQVGLPDDFAVSFWLNRRNPTIVADSDQLYYRNFQNYLPFSVVAVQRLDIKRVQIIVDKKLNQTGIYTNCFIQQGTAVLYVSQVIDDFTMIVNTPDVVSEGTYRITTCEILPSTYLNYTGFLMAFVAGRYIYIILGQTHFKFDTGLSSVTDSWIAFLVNVSASFSFIETYVYGIEDRFPQYPGKYSTVLKQLSKQSKPIMSAVTGYTNQPNNPLYLSFSHSQITNIRLWKEPIEEEIHNLVLNQPQVQAANKGLVIDNADPVYRYDKLGRGINKFYSTTPEVNPEE